MNNHTPGTWELVTEKPTAIRGMNAESEIRGNGGRYVVVRLGVLMTEEAEANAQLIASAPDLLRACKAAIAVLDGPKGLPIETAAALLDVLKNAVSE